MTLDPRHKRQALVCAVVGALLVFAALRILH